MAQQKHSNSIWNEMGTEMYICNWKSEYDTLIDHKILTNLKKIHNDNTLCNT